MATFDFPPSLKPSAAAVQLNRIAQTFRSPFGGSPQVGDVLSERWQLSLTFPPDVLGDSGAAEALAMRLAGGFNRVRVSHPVRPEPRGTLRGTPTLYSSAAAGASSIVITGGTGKNLCLSSSFEEDADGNGLANGWVSNSGGVVSDIVFTRPTYSVHGDKSQKITVSALGTTASDFAGIYRDADIPVGGPGPMTCSMYYRCTTNARVRLRVDYRDAGGNNLGIAASVTALSDGVDWRRHSVLLSSVPPDATQVRIQLRLEQTTNGGAANAYFDAVQLESGPDATAYEPGGGTLQPGDILGLNGQWLQVAEYAEPNGFNATTVHLVNRLRNAVSAGDAVTWNRPTILMAAPGQAGAVAYGIGASDGMALDLEEVW